LCPHFLLFSGKVVLPSCHSEWSPMSFISRRFRRSWLIGSSWFWHSALHCGNLKVLKHMMET
jgi:hypothetical protein